MEDTNLELDKTYIQVGKIKREIIEERECLESIKILWSEGKKYTDSLKTVIDTQEALANNTIQCAEFMRSPSFDPDSIVDLQKTNHFVLEGKRLANLLDSNSLATINIFHQITNEHLESIIKN